MKTNPISRRQWLGALPLLGMLSLAPPAQAHDFKAGQLVIDHPYATPTSPGTRNSAAYFRGIRNTGRALDRLIAAGTAVAERVELHEMTMDGDIMRMREVPAIELPAGQTLRLRHGEAGHHLMLVNVKQALVAGDRFDLTLRFEKAGERVVKVWVQQPRSAGTRDAHQHR